jgi:hypothetical protein
MTTTLSVGAQRCSMSHYKVGVKDRLYYSKSLYLRKTEKGKSYIIPKQIRAAPSSQLSSADDTNYLHLRYLPKAM